MLTKEQIEDLIASESAWYHKGSLLKEASNMLRQWATDGAFQEGVSIGAATVPRSLESDMPEQIRRRQLVADMMYAFAVENWLKGLIVAQMVRTSDQAGRVAEAELNHRLDIELQRNEPWDPVELWDRIQEVSNLPEVQGKFDQANQARRDENSERANAALARRFHDLLGIAENAGVKQLLDEEDHKYVNSLSMANELGRYPAPIRAEKTQGVETLLESLDNPDARTRLDKAICDRYGQLEPNI